MSEQKLNLLLLSGFVFFFTVTVTAVGLRAGMVKETYGFLAGSASGFIGALLLILRAGIHGGDH